ncbi:MAG TPA: hypothetical protein VFN94_11205 [Nitrospiria bacterium]|nr:hypothetical protein [Nitrospiria bacterium]
MKRWTPRIISVAFCSALGLVWGWQPPDAEAIPAWARQYSADCSLCHYPAVPRLNATGYRFRWAGFRMPEEFGQEPDVTAVGNYLSARGRGRYVYADSDQTETVSEFQWHDTTLFYAGAITPHLSAFNELEWEAEDEVSLVAQLQWLSGRSEHFTTVRAGQFHTLPRVGIGPLDRPTGISTPSIFSERLTTSPIPFRLSDDQRGIEVAHIVRTSRLALQATNGLDASGSGTAGDADTAKDVLLVYERLLDATASGLTLLGYRGVWHDGLIDDDYTFYRYGGTVNKVLPVGLDVLGGYIRSHDHLPSVVGPNVQAQAFFLELQQYLRRPDVTVLARYDWIDPDQDTAQDRRQRQTLGVVKSVERYLRLALEGQRATDRASATGYALTAEAMVNF